MCYYRAAPQLTQYLDSQNLAKPKTDKKGKKGKDADRSGGTGDASQLIDMTDFVNAASTSNSNHLVPSNNGLAAMPPPNGGSVSSTPAPRAGFTKVGSFVAHPAAAPAESSNNAPMLGGSIRLKRKAEDEGLNTPPTKRR